MTVNTGVKITNLGEATIPLAGTEVAVIVQDGVTRKVQVEELSGSNAAVIWPAMQTDALAAGNNNNLAPDISEVARLGLTPVNDTAVLTGLAGGEAGKLLFIMNHSTADFFTILAESGLSTAENRFAINGDLIIPARCGALFIYDETVDRWVKS